MTMASENNHDAWSTVKFTSSKSPRYFFHFCKLAFYSFNANRTAKFRGPRRIPSGLKVTMVFLTMVMPYFSLQKWRQAQSFRMSGGLRPSSEDQKAKNGSGCSTDLLPTLAWNIWTLRQVWLWLMIFLILPASTSDYVVLVVESLLQKCPAARG